MGSTKSVVRHTHAIATSLVSALEKLFPPRRLSIHLNKLIGSNFSSPSKTNEFDNWIVRGDSLSFVDTQKNTSECHGKVSSCLANYPKKSGSALERG